MATAPVRHCCGSAIRMARVARITAPPHPPPPPCACFHPPHSRAPRCLPWHFRTGSKSPPPSPPVLVTPLHESAMSQQNLLRRRCTVCSSGSCSGCGSAVHIQGCVSMKGGYSLICGHRFCHKFTASSSPCTVTFADKEGGQPSLGFCYAKSKVRICLGVLLAGVGSNPPPLLRSNAFLLGGGRMCVWGSVNHHGTGGWIRRSVSAPQHSALGVRHTHSPT